MAIQWVRATDYDAMCREAAARIAAVVEQGAALARPVALGLATGNTMLGVYERLADALGRRRVDLSQLHTFNLDEYVGDDGRWIPADHPLSYHAYMREHFFQRLDPALAIRPEHVHFPDPADPGAIDVIVDRLGGLDLQLLGIGFNGHIGFNEPMSGAEISAAEFAATPSRVVDLTELTIQTNARLTAGGDRAEVPRRAATVGMKTILAAREILLLACFAEQAEPLQQIRHGGATPELPASYLTEHPRATIIYTADTITLGEEG